MLFIWVIFLLLLNFVTSKVLQIVWMVPYSYPDYNISTSVGPLAMALKRVKDEQTLSDYDDFNVTWLDSECSSQKSVGHLTEYLISQDHIDVIIGPPCSNAMVPVANLAGYYNIPVFTWMSREHILDDKSVYSTLVRTRPPITSLVYVFYSISEKFKWKRAAILYTDEVPSTKTLAVSMITKFNEDKEFDLVKQYIVSLSATNDEMHTIFESIKRNARILFVLIPRTELRRYMLAFYDYGMTGGDYQFLFTEMDLAELNILYTGSLWRGDDGRDNEARIAFGSLLYFTFIYVVDADEQWLEVSEAYDEMFVNSTLPSPISPDRHSTFLYDAVVLYAAALNETITTKKTSNGTEIFKAVQYKTFTGLSGEVFMNDVSDRFPSFAVWDLAPDGTFQMVLSLNYTPGPPDGSVKYNKTVVEYTDIIWGDGRTSSEYSPPDVPSCGFFNELCPVDSSLTVLLASVLSVVAIIIIIVVVLVGRWWRREKDINQMFWNIPFGDLDFNFRKKRKKSKSDNVSMAGHESLASDSSSIHTDSLVETSHSSILGSFGSIMGGGAVYDTKILLARYRTTIVVVKSIRKDNVRLDRKFLIHMRELFSMKHPNLATLIGMCTETDKINVLWEYCSKGSLQDLVANSDKMKLDGAFQFSIANDICCGLMFIHGGPMRLHGNLKSTNCIIDNHWACKLTDFGMVNIKVGEDLEAGVNDVDRYSKLFWMAPEMLRHHLLQIPYTLTPEADIFSLGVILKELLCLNRPYSHEQSLTPKEIVQLVASPIDKLMRPVMLDLNDEYAPIRNGFKRLICNCWAEDPVNRPSIKRITLTIKKLSPYNFFFLLRKPNYLEKRSSTVLDNMFMMMERYSNRLEEVVSERTGQLEDEKKKTEALLYKMLPKTVADELKLGNHVKAEYYDAVTVYFSDIVGFTKLAAESTPMQIVDFLNSLYSLFDDIIQRYDVYKVETIGDAYMVASGIPLRNGEKHVTEMADVSLTLLECVLNYKIPHRPDTQLQIRIGLQTGPAVTGVVGLTMPRYCLFGDTVNTASRMESNGRPLLIHITPDTQRILKRNPQYRILERGKVHIKGKGLMETFWLVGKRGLFEIPDDIIQEQVSLAYNANKFKRASRDDPEGNESDMDTASILHGNIGPYALKGQHDPSPIDM